MFTINSDLDSQTAPYGTGEGSKNHPIDEYYIRRCLILAEEALGQTSPNPMVGSIVLDAFGRVVGQGFHARAGEAHAEVIALQQAGPAARGGTLYASLEPCNHTGRTGPCTEAILQSGIARVVFGQLDPNPKVNGSGLAKLMSAGLEVIPEVLSTECEKLNEVFNHAIQTQTPFVTLKLAMTLDGKIATRSGQSQWITGQLARQYVHHLRAQSDAILTTASTVKSDNPSLSVRLPGQSGNAPIRVILDRYCQLGFDEYAIFNTENSNASNTVWVVSAPEHQTLPYLKRAQDRGIEILSVPDTGFGLDLTSLMKLLGERRIHSLLIEAGGKLTGDLVKNQLVNKYCLFYAPKIVGDNSALSGLDQRLSLNLADCPQLKIHQTRKLDPDILVEAYPN